MDLLADRYELGDALGHGRSTVYRATDTRLRRAVAIKRVQLLAGHEEVAQVRARALREAQATARIVNPATVTVYDVVEETGAIWLVMELVDGPSLAQLVADEGPLPHERAARIGLQVLTALEAAHLAGVVHRDVKPANVLLSDDDRAKLTDFGVATIRDESRVTLTGIVVGSPSYMAPEQATAGEITPATDLWALGALLYFAVEGEPPFLGGTALATAAAVVHEPPRAQRRHGPLSSLIARLLTKDPAARASAGTARTALSRVGDPRAASATTAIFATPIVRSPAPPPTPPAPAAPVPDPTLATPPPAPAPAPAVLAQPPTSAPAAPLATEPDMAADDAEPLAEVQAEAPAEPGAPAEPAAPAEPVAPAGLEGRAEPEPELAAEGGRHAASEVSDSAATETTPAPKTDAATRAEATADVAETAAAETGAAAGSEAVPDPAAATGSDPSPETSEATVASEPTAASVSSPASGEASPPREAPSETAATQEPEAPAEPEADAAEPVADPTVPAPSILAPAPAGRTDPARRRTGPAPRVPWRAVAAVAAVVLLVVVLATRGGGGGGGDETAGDGSPSTTAEDTATSADPGATEAPGETTTTVASTPTTAPGTLPAGWVPFSDPSGAYTIGHPPGWQVDRINAQRLDLRDPATGAFLRIEWVEPPGPDVAGAWYQIEPGFQADNPGYERVGITEVAYRDYPAALWEFRHGTGDVLHTGNLGFITAGRGYALMLRTPEGQWAASQPLFEQFKQAFQPT